MLNAEVIEKLLYRCMTWTLRAEHFAKLQKAHHQVLLRVIRFQLRLRADHANPSYAKSLKNTRCESIGTTIRKQWPFFAGAVARQSKARILSRGMFGMMAGGVNPKPDAQFKTWHRCIVKDSREFRATEESTEHSPLEFGVETALWSTAAKKPGKWYRRVLEAAERFMVRWDEDEAQLSSHRRESAVGDAQLNGGRGGNRRSGRKPNQGNTGRGGNRRSRRETAVDESRNDMADRVARHQAG